MISDVDAQAMTWHIHTMQDNSDYKNSVIIMIIEKAAAAAFLFSLAHDLLPKAANITTKK